MMSRFESELRGAFGSYWKRRAENELEEIRTNLKEGRITIDTNGVARNSIGRVLMSDMVEKVSYVTPLIDINATAAAREEEISRELAEYRANAGPATVEEILEMRAAFGAGQVVINVLTGERIQL